MSSSAKRNVFFNSNTAPIAKAGDTSPVQAFHAQLPSYTPTPLKPLPTLARTLGIKALFLKDESRRLGLPAFKILGASWGTYRALLDVLGLPHGTPLSEVAIAAKKRDVTLFAATEGNHGRAVAAMARILGVKARIHVPKAIDPRAAGHIASEGAEVVQSTGDYDIAVAEAFAAAARTPNGVCMQDTSFEGYERIPAWIVEGYSTMLHEVREQLHAMGEEATALVTPVGVGSLAHAVVRHCKSCSQNCGVVAVEPDTAPCLHESLRAGRSVTAHSERGTIMDGMNCGTVSAAALGELSAGVDVSVVLSSLEAHWAVKALEENGVKVGPCGAASLGALWKIREAGGEGARSVLSEDAVVVLLGTEGPREYEVPEGARQHEGPILASKI
ncbi:hypothetical protein ACHAQH_002562 [Verticillium albo-atrum]